MHPCHSLRHSVDPVSRQVWRSYGLRQHIFCHADPRGTDARGYESGEMHYCHMPCMTDWHVEDDLQEQAEELREAQGLLLGSDMHDRTLAGRLESIWYNHWRCEEEMQKMHPSYKHDRPNIMMSSGGICWSNIRFAGGVSPKSPYMPMLTCCKAMYVPSLPFQCCSTNLLKLPGKHQISLRIDYVRLPR